MKTLLPKPLRVTLGAILLLIVGIGLAQRRHMPAVPVQLKLGMLALVMMALVFAT
ncbi:MAG: hypothetical protein JF619_09865, partial [Massilia sp.]|nr:hypothetical protein [Massilia sp.]